MVEGAVLQSMTPDPVDPLWMPQAIVLSSKIIFLEEVLVLFSKTNVFS